MCRKWRSYGISDNCLDTWIGSVSLPVQDGILGFLFWTFCLDREKEVRTLPHALWEAGLSHFSFFILFFTREIAIPVIGYTNESMCNLVSVKFVSKQREKSPGKSAEVVDICSSRQDNWEGSRCASQILGRYLHGGDHEHTYPSKKCSISNYANKK